MARRIEVQINHSCVLISFFFAIQKVYKKKATNKQTKRNLHDDDDDEYAGGNFNGEEKM